MDRAKTESVRHRLKACHSLKNKRKCVSAFKDGLTIRGSRRYRQNKGKFRYKAVFSEVKWNSERSRLYIMYKGRLFFLPSIIKKEYRYRQTKTGVNNYVVQKSAGRHKSGETQ